MKRYLLFDSGCTRCANIARAIEQQANNKLSVRSLHEPEMQTLLDQANPNWKWEPTLLEVHAGHVRMFTRRALVLRLVMRLGPRRAWELAKTVKRYSGSLTADVGRRQFLRQSGIGLLATFLLLGRQKAALLDSRVAEEVQTRQSTAGSSVDMEIYEGFVILPEQAPLPDFVRTARPIDLHAHDPYFAGNAMKVSSIDELKSWLSFPLYIPAKLPYSMTVVETTILEFVRTGDIWGIYIKYATDNPRDGHITVWARPEYSKPFPVRPVRNPFDSDDEFIFPTKVTFTPAPGLMSPSMLGYNFLWIKHNILYSFFVDNYSDQETAISIAASLAAVE